MPNLTILFPPGPGTVRTSFNKLLVGVRQPVTLDLQGATYQTLQAAGVSDWGKQSAFGIAEADANNNLGYDGQHTYTTNDLLKACRAGDTVLYLLQPGAAQNTGKYRVGARVSVQSGETEGDDGYPGGCEYCEPQVFTITGLNLETGALTLDKPLLFTHRTDTRDFPNGVAGGTGLPRVRALDRQGSGEGPDGYTYPSDVTVRNGVIAAPQNGLVATLNIPAENLTLEDLDLYQLLGPSQVLGAFTARRCILRVGGEMDKELNVGLLDACQVYGVLTNGRWQQLTVQGTVFHDASFGPAGRHIRLGAGNTLCAGVFVFHGQSATQTAYCALFDQAGRKPVDLLELAAPLTLTSVAGNTAPAYLGFTPFSYLVAPAAPVAGSTDWVLPYLGNGHQNFIPICQLRVGMAIFKADGSAGGRLTAKVWDASLNAYRLQGTWPQAPQQGETWGWCYVRRVTDVGGHLVTGDQTKRVFDQDMRRWQGNTALTGPVTTVLPVAELIAGGAQTWGLNGWVRRVEVRVPTAGTGVLEVNINPNVGGFQHLCVLDLTQPGTRVLTATSATGVVGNDQVNQAAFGAWGVDAHQYASAGSLPPGLEVRLTWETYETMLPA